MFLPEAFKIIIVLLFNFIKILLCQHIVCKFVSRSRQWGFALAHLEAVCSSEYTCSWESINVKTVNYFTVHQSMSEKREFVLWRGAQSSVSDSSFLCHEFMGLGSVLHLLCCFFFFTVFCKASGRICLCCNESRFQTPLLKLLSTWAQTQTCAPSQEPHLELDSYSSVAAHSWVGSSGPPLQFWM